MMNRPQCQIVFEVFEGAFDLTELHVEVPQLLRGSPRGDVGAQQVTALSFAGLPKFIFAQGEVQLCGLLVD